MTEYEAFRGPRVKDVFGLTRHDHRWDGIEKFGYAIPNDEAIQLLISLGPITELGAGLGYWAHLITEGGGQIQAYDIHPGEGNEYKPIREGKPWHPVMQGGVEVLHDNDCPTLLLCWPCYMGVWAEEALAAFKGDRVAYVGEGYGGCTATDAFHDTLNDAWELETTVCIPRWEHIGDQLYIYKRK